MSAIPVYYLLILKRRVQLEKKQRSLTNKRFVLTQANTIACSCVYPKGRRGEALAEPGDFSMEPYAYTLWIHAPYRIWEFGAKS